MKSVAIVATRAITSLGNLDETWKGAPDELLAGPAGPRPGQPCDTANYIARKLGLKGPAKDPRQIMIK